MIFRLAAGQRGDFGQPGWSHGLLPTLHEPCARLLPCRWEAPEDTQGPHPVMTGERSRQRGKIPPLVRCTHESAPFDKGVYTTGPAKPAANAVPGN